MHRVRTTAVVVAFTALTSVAFTIRSPAAGAPQAQLPPEESGTVVRVIDGDTLDVDLAGGRERVRLLGVNTPERGSHERPAEYFARESTAYVRRVADHRRVVLRGDPGHENRDAYGRLLRYVYLPDGLCLNVELLRQGYARALTRYPFTRSKEFRRYEREARDTRRGLWEAR
jgi:micrococcal nuclease